MQIVIGIDARKIFNQSFSQLLKAELDVTVAGRIRLRDKDQSLSSAVAIKP